MSRVTPNPDELKLQSLGHYRIEGILERDARGVVYKGYDTVSEQFATLKVVPAELFKREGGEAWWKRCKPGLQAIAKGMHPNIVTVFEYGEDRNVYYIAREYIQGQTLQDYLINQAYCDEKNALHIITQVLSALCYAHKFGIVHGDIKPTNIILLEGNHVKVTDFGLPPSRYDLYNSQGPPDLIMASSAKSAERLRQQLVDLQQRWDTLRQKLAYLRKEQIVETRVEERFRMEQLISGAENERVQVERELQDLEQQLPSPGSSQHDPSPHGEVSSLLQDSKMLITPDYMAPEQLLGKPVTAATDLFATGVILVELLTGKRPFPGRTATEVAQGILRNNPLELRELNPPAPVSLHSVIVKALAKDPELRFQTAGEFTAALKEALPGTFARNGPHPVEPSPLPDAGGEKAVVQEMDAGLTWEPAVLRQIEEQLIVYVGPLAKIMVKRAARQTTDIRSLYQTLAQSIPTGLERTRFLKTAGYPQENADRVPLSSPVAPTQKDGFNPQRLEAIAHELAVYVGPIAKVLVNKTAGQAASLEDLYRRLSSHIPSEAERTDFLKKLPTGTG